MNLGRAISQFGRSIVTPLPGKTRVLNTSVFVSQIGVFLMFAYLLSASNPSQPSARRMLEPLRGFNRAEVWITGISCLSAGFLVSAFLVITQKD
jgi:hypothetical protein